MLGTVAVLEGSDRRPLPIPEEQTSLYRWLNKPVLAFRILDDMESDEAWSHHGYGRMESTRERAQSGVGSLRLISPTKGERPGPVAGRPFGEAVVRRVFPREDWGEYNRLSFWVYPHLPGFKVISMLVRLHNDGEVKVPDSYGREGLNYFLLKPEQWNRVVWEIPHLARDRVTAVDFVYRLQGNEPGATEVVQFDVDRLELQEVAADGYEGWLPASGRIAYCQAGYTPEGQKSALVNGLNARRFSVRRVSDRAEVFTGRVREWEGEMAALQVLDFTGLCQPGEYLLEAGGLRTPAFVIGADVWRDSILKTLNFFYAQRCGDVIPRIHDLCHRDWRAIHEGETLVINGGWHDAGDLSQGLVNTAEAVYAMLTLAEELKERDPTLAAQLIEEGQWGLEWVLKTRFSDGSRVSWATMDFWTDGELGTVDDCFGEVRRNAYDLSVATYAEATAARVLSTINPPLAQASLERAKEDWSTAMSMLGEPRLEVASLAALASVELYRATADPACEERAVALARVIQACQQRDRMDWALPLSGFFYTNAKRERLLHYSHRGHEQAPIVALVRLCEAFPDHSEWINWYGVVASHSEYLRTMAKVTEPYGVMPASVYDVNESDDPRFGEQVRNGIRMDDRHYLRVFPVWYDLRGNSGTILSQAKALSSAARLRRRVDLEGLVHRQLEWHLGRNPFCQSLIYGVGHDFAPQYSAMSGDIVGSLPVGVQTRGNADLPYWPAANCYNYKEVWVHPSSRWLWIQADLYAGVGATRMPGIERMLVASRSLRNGRVRIDVRVRGAGKHGLALRTSNLEVATPVRELDLSAGRWHRVVWEGRIAADREPWVAVVVPDGQVSARIEVPVDGGERESRSGSGL